MYYQNYHRKPTIKKTSKEDEINRQISNLKEKFGNDLKKPDLKDFGLDQVQIDTVVKFNNKISDYNNKKKFVVDNCERVGIITYIILVLIILLLLAFLGAPGYALFYLFIILGVASGVVFEKMNLFLINIFYKKYHNSTKSFDEYIKLVNSYPGQHQITYLLEQSTYLKNLKKQREYWFSISGHEFEEQVTRILKKYNYKDVTKTKGSGDGGVDIVVTKNDGSVILIQCKAHKKAIGPEAVRSLFGVMAKEGTLEGVMISLGGFSVGARDFAEGEKIKLLDVDDVIRMNNIGA